MPVNLIQDSVSIAANAVNANVVSGNAHEFVEEDSLLQFGLAGSATGLRVDISVGNQAAGLNIAVNLQNRFPVFPDDFPLLDVPALAGSRVVIQGRNTTGGALTLFFAVKIVPV